MCQRQRGCVEIFWFKQQHRLKKEKKIPCSLCGAAQPLLWSQTGQSESEKCGCKLRLCGLRKVPVVHLSALFFSLRENRTAVAYFLLDS